MAKSYHSMTLPAMPAKRSRRDRPERREAWSAGVLAMCSWPTNSAAQAIVDVVHVARRASDSFEQHAGFRAVMRSVVDDVRDELAERHLKRVALRILVVND